MTTRFKATIQPEVFKWARESARLELAVVAEKLGVEVDTVKAWERGDDRPSIAKLRKAAELFRRPLAVMYLPEPPLSFQPMHDFRRLPEVGGGQYSPELAYEMRLAHQRREIALEAVTQRDEKPQPVPFSVDLKDNPEAAGSTIRDALGVDYETQSAWREDRVAFHGWRARLEDQGVLVFQASRVDSSEVSGFAFYADVLPFIVVNRKDSWGRRVFSLLHEVVHLALHRSGVSDFDGIGPRNEIDQQVEVFCNKVAAAALMPRERFLSETILQQNPGRNEWSDAEIAELARIYAVSREAVVRRLLTLGRATEDFYARKRAQYVREYVARKIREKEKRGDQGIPRNMPRETLSDLGRPLVGLLLSQYHADRLSLSELSGFLGVKARHIDGIERALVGG